MSAAVEEIIAGLGLSPADVARLSEEAPSQKDTEVPLTEEFRRIRDLPRRDVADGERYAADLTEALRTPHGTMALRPIQALALFELFHYGGAFCPIRTGGGKTLVSLLAPLMRQALRPLLLIPKSLQKKTEQEFRALSIHWKSPTLYTIKSYEWLSHKNSAAFLDKYRPDLIVMDEADNLSNTASARTRRVRRYLQKNPGVSVVAMSGSFTKRSIKDYSHIISWCLPRTCPTPREYRDLMAWSALLDERSADFMGAGAMRQLFDEREKGMVDEIEASRSAYRRRLLATPGVIATQETPLTFPLVGRVVTPVRTDPVIDDHLTTLFKDWETPNGDYLQYPIELWAHARWLSLGFYYRWVPPPPPEWREAKRAWSADVRYVLKYNKRGLDSPAEVADAVEAGTLALPSYWDWKAVEKTYVYDQVPEWISTEALETAKVWGERERGLIWVDLAAFGRRLSAETGWPYYGSKGLDARGRMVEQHPAGQPAILGVRPNRSGRNLQTHHKNLILSCEPAGRTWEQMISRTHRDGQEAPAVYLDVYCPSTAQIQAVYQATHDCAYSEQSLGSPQKLLRVEGNLLDQACSLIDGTIRYRAFGRDDDIE